MDRRAFGRRSTRQRRKNPINPVNPVKIKKLKSNPFNTHCPCRMKMSCSQFGKFRKYLNILAALLLVLLLATFAIPQDETEKSPGVDVRQEMLKREATDAFRRLKRAMEKDGIYSGRVALNIWRSTAQDAGTFDQSQYDEIKTQLYEKSVNDSLRCFEEFMLEEDFYNANFCLQIWRMHSKELDTYDQAEYEAFKKQLEDAKAAKASRRVQDK